MIYTIKQQGGGFLGALLIGLGLSYAGLTSPETIFSFLHLEHVSVAFAAPAALIIIAICFKVLPGITKSPIFWGEFENRDIISGMHIVFGGILFGIGWGISGMSPTTALVALGNGMPEALGSIFGIILGILFAAGFYRR